MNIHPNTTPASPSPASPLTDAAFDSIESLTSSFATSSLTTLGTTTVTEVALGYHRNQQYSITAMTTSTGAVAERYAYTAYGQPTILNASGTVLTSSAVGNRYTYTGREWDETLGLHHFRARWMSPLAGRFLGRDPIGYESEKSLFNLARRFASRVLDPLGESLQDPTVDKNIHIVSKPNATLGFLKCDQTPEELYDYSISAGAPCNGWLIQMITVCCDSTKCKNCDNCDAMMSDSRKCETYFEAWEFDKGSLVPTTGRNAGWPATDAAVFSTPKSTCGRFCQYGEVRFFCNHWKDDSNSVFQTVGRWKDKISVNLPGCGRVHSGKLNGTKNKPWFWDLPLQDINGYDEEEHVGANYRGMNVTWKCCGESDDFINASTFNGSGNFARP